MKYVLVLVAMVVMMSCNQKKIERLQAQQDSTARVSFKKDTTILGFISAMNDIQGNLDSIKALEKIISVQSAPGTEMKADAKKQIIEDVKAIHDLLRKNKELADNLQKRLNKSNVKIAELEKMVANMNKQIEEKDAEIAKLNDELQKLHIDIEGLNVRVKDMTTDIEKKSQTIKENTQLIEQQTTEINTAYYIVGTTRKLADSNVIEKEGGVLGVGRAIKMRKDFSRDSFTKIDIRNFNELKLDVKKAKIITTHPVGSYHLTGDKTVESLIIDNPTEFWSASKFLVIVTN